MELKSKSGGKKQEKPITHCSELFDVLGTFLADCIGFTVNNKKGFISKRNYTKCRERERDSLQ